MADLLGATNPVPGYDNAGAGRGTTITPNDPQIKNIPEPSRVSRPDGREEHEDAGDAAKSSRLRYGSNFQTFLQRLRQSPDLVQTLSRLLRQGTLVTSGMSEGLATEMSQVLEMLKMDEGQLLRFLTDQMKASARFGGPLFALLRNAYAGTQSQALREDILQFLKKFNDFSSTAHIEGNLLREVSGMAKNMPASYGAKLMELLAQLQNGVAAGDRAGNLKLLQGQIVPYFSDYVGRTHDMGQARALLSFLSLDIARYENGSERGLMQAFRQLCGYGSLRDTLGSVSDAELLKLLRSTGFAKAAQNNAFADQLAAAAGRALRGEGGTEMQETFRELVSALLINESVYMPVNHMVIPLDWDGKMMFSELWVDPDAEGEHGEQSAQNTIRFLFKLDIQELGAFDIILSCQGERVSLHVGCPERVAPFSSIVSGAMRDILQKNGLRPEGVSVERLDRPVAISEVFPHIFEGRNGVNVTI